MCLAVPLKILSIEGKTAVGEAAGLKQTVRVDFIPDLQCGEYVMVHAGFAIQKLTEEQARENLECIREAVDAL
ncbi:MAG: HypC/HybG/HupF family hydrogenase formation chaperone [Hydrogeniiclostridium sp.]